MSTFLPYIGTEDNFQMAVARYLDYEGVLWNHTANERKTNSMVSKKGVRYSPGGNKLKAKGVKSGVPDVMIYELRGNYNGLAIELKVGRNPLSENQKIWL